MNNAIIIKGAEEHNLKKINITIERNKFVVITGVSGSGKSSLAFNTLYAEGQRRYVESLSTYARQFIGHMNKPAVESIEGLSPAIAIEQKTIGRNPRSTVGTITEIYDYYRLMFARIGVPYDPDTNLPLQRTTIDEIVDVVLSYPEGTKLMVLSPVVRNKKGTHGKIIEDAGKLGFTRLRIDGTLTTIDDDIALPKTFKHSIDIVTGRVVISSENASRVVEAFEKALELSQGNASALFIMDNNTEEERHFSLHYAYQNPEYSVPEIEPQLFSFNSPVGSCPQCSGLGYTMEFNESLVIPDYSLTFYEHGIAPFSEKWNWYSTQIEGLAQALGVSLHDPFDAWPKDAIRQLLYGSEKNISFIFKSASGTRSITRRFPGLLHELLRRYRTTQDPGFREWLEQFMEKRACSMCGGGRLRREALFVKVNGVSIQQLTAMTVLQSIEFFEQLQLSERDGLVAKEILKEIQSRLSFLKEVGLSYLSMDRYAGTLSGGESQRIRLASQIGSALVGVMYVLDEPTIGLHQRDNERLLQMLLHLRDLGNTIIVVEHDEQAINTADMIVDIGPFAGKNGGEVVAHGTPAQVMKKNTLTGKYLSGKLFMELPRKRRESKGGTYISLYGACEHNLKSIDATFPLGTLNVITGVSGSGKSTLLQDILYPAIHNVLLRTKLSCGAYQKIEGIEFLNKVIDIDQSPIGRTPRSNPGTYVKIFDGIRALFAQLPESKARGYTPGRFSFNVRGGRCEACQGAGEQIIEMHFLSDVYVTCEVCQGKRFNRETLDIYYKGKNVCDVLNMTVDEATEFFEKIPGIYRRLKVLQQVGMGYITLGQSAVTLSGGEAQRIKLALELAKQNTGNTLYLLDEPTTGLHQADIINLMKVLHELVDRGNTIILIEHNLEVIAQADYILDLGPEGGYDGGEVVACGTPEQIIRVKKSYTGVFLKPYLQRRT